MYRTHHCGELRIENKDQRVKLSGWVQKIRNLGGMTFVDIRDRYGLSQLVFDLERNEVLSNSARELGREFVISVSGIVLERSNKNKNMPTGDIEILVDEIEILSKSEIPPFTIEDETDGGEELRMKYRYLDLRRNPIRRGLELRHKMSREFRNYLDNNNFVEAETPVLIKSTPEGARDFVVPSRMHAGEFYALPQSPQIFKQLFMVAGLDRYYQIVKCFRDEDFRADRQPEFTQIDCEMSFVDEDDVIKMLEGMAKHLFKTIKGIDFTYEFPRLTYEYAMNNYGSDKPDLRFDMKIHPLNDIVKNKGFKVFDDSEYVGGICVENAALYTRKQLDSLTDFVKTPQVGAKGLVYVKYNEDGTLKSSVDKFYSEEELKKWAEALNAKKGDLLLVVSGEMQKSLEILGKLRLEMGKQLGLMPKDKFVPLWVVDFPLLEWNEESKRFHAMHHPFTSPKKEDLNLLDKNPAKVRANAYDFVINGNEIGGGSIRIFDEKLQHKMFDLLGFTKEQAEAQFGFLMSAFKYGAPPHGGAAFGLDRWVALFNGSDSIRDVIAFPKNNAGRDIMNDAPALIDDKQLKELSLIVVK
ncbi:MAG: aspartate--tRNA ligase [Bacteroidales bacterium]|nr:aspartate--tRNA ligase [Bacteroidales bacterium]MBN2758658.1 aspartate--tRNA ligase [Bacteroidales bacterium]